jgi:1,4-alpha-glucan branching enzyme
MSFLREMNESLYHDHPGVQTIAEEATSWPLVSKPTTIGGLGFGMKWDMGWMHDTLRYLSRDPAFRRWHHDELTFRSMYGFQENYVLPLSHDEVVYGKGSLLRKMPGDDWQRFANLRLLLSYEWALPGKKLLFMGGELGTWDEWNHDAAIDWSLLERPEHGAIARLVGTLNHVYKTEPALHRHDAESRGFEWLDGGNGAQSVLTFLRRGDGAREVVLVALNFTPEPRVGYRAGVPVAGAWSEIHNSDAADVGGSGMGNLGRVVSEPVPWNGQSDSIVITLPPLGAVFLRPE